MRNLNWSTQLESYTPYKKDDILEFIYITKMNPEARAKINFWPLAEKLQITEILVNDVPTSLDKIQDITSNSALKITIRGKAKDPGITKEVLPNLIQIDRVAKPKPQEISEVTPFQNYTIPQIYTWSSGTLSSNIDQLLVLTGKNLESIDRIIVGETSFEGKIQENKFYYLVPKNTFGNGEYFVGLYLKNGQLIPTNTKLSFTYNSNPINIAAITPKILKNNEDSYVVVQGNGFKKMISIQLSNNLIFKNALFTIINDQVVSIKIPKWLDPGIYYFNIMDTAGIYEAKNMPFTVTSY